MMAVDDRAMLLLLLATPFVANDDVAAVIAAITYRRSVQKQRIYVWAIGHHEHHHSGAKHQKSERKNCPILCC
jgi:hypothetical protein